MLRPTALHQALLGALLAMGMLPATTIHAQSVSVDELHTRQLIIEANRQKAHEAWLRENTLPTVTSIGQREEQASEQRGSYTMRRSRASTGLSLSLRQTPQSVSVITHQQLQDQEASTLADTMRYTPGVSANTYDARGVSLHARGFSVDNLRTDGVPMALSGPWSAGETREDTILYDRMEVVRGATGLFTGAGEPSAAINQVRKHADSRTLTGRISLGLGSWKKRGIDADISGPLNADGSVRGRIVADYGRRHSYIDLYQTRRHTLYGVLDADLTPDVQLSLGASDQRDTPEAGMWGGLPIWHDDGSHTNWPRSKTTAPTWARWGSKTRTYFATLKQQLNDWSLQLSYNRIHRESNARLLWAMGQPNRDTGLGMTTTGASWYDASRKQQQVDLQVSRPFQHGDMRHELVMGISHARLDFDAAGRTPTAGVQRDIGNFNAWDGSYPYPTAWGEPFVASSSLITQNAMFGVLRLQLSSPTHLILGSRISNYEQDEAASRFQAKAYTLNHKRKVTPYAGITHDLSPETTAYASYTTIFKPQANQDRNGNYLSPIDGKSYEIGLKGEALNGHLQGTIALYRIQQDNLAQADGDARVPGTVTQAYLAARGARSTGYEITVTGSLSPVWDLNLGWTQYRLKDASGQDLNTDRPRKQLKIFTTYRLDEELQGLTLGSGVTWQERTYADLTNPVTRTHERLMQKSYALVDLMARYQVDSNWTLQFNVHNLFDKKYFDSVGFSNTYSWGPSRHYALSASYRF